jgi:hypothetical protein
MEFVKYKRLMIKQEIFEGQDRHLYFIDGLSL